VAKIELLWLALDVALAAVALAAAGMKVRDIIRRRRRKRSAL
jgi:hypothetical protein